MSEEAKFEIRIREGCEMVRRMDRKIDLVERLLAKSEAAILPLFADFTNSIGMEMVWCPPGTFWMGSPVDEEGRFKDEALHEVTITSGFWIGRFPVTQRQWRDVMGQNRTWFKDSGPDAPDELVNWSDAQEFCVSLSRLDGHDYTLPTEAQWEYACRAGSKSTYFFGNDQERLKEYAWYSESTDDVNPIGQKKANGWGIHDMIGNVTQWCLDWYGEYPSGKVTDPTGPTTGSYRVLRGSCASFSERHCRSAYRTFNSPGSRYFAQGFRVVKNFKP